MAKPILTRKPGPYPSDRRCAHPRCETILSTYNPSERCALHGERRSCGRGEHREALRELMQELPA